jgi:hypothetical protein
LLANSGRFRETLPLILATQPFANFARFSRQLFAKSGKTHRISLLRLFDLVHDIAGDAPAIDSEQLMTCLAADYARSGLKSVPRCLRASDLQTGKISASARYRQRQARH